MMLPGNDAREASSSSFSLVVREKFDIRETLLSILAGLLVLRLRTVHERDKVQEGEFECRVVRRRGSVFLRIKKFGKLLRIKLRSKGSCFDHPDELERVTNLRIGSMWVVVAKLQVLSKVLWEVLIVEARWRRRRCGKGGRGWRKRRRGR